MRAPTRRLPPAPAGAAGRTRVMQMELEQFASRLQHFRNEKGWSQSALAREVWGEIETKTGRKAARNRDRISTYEMGKSWPDPHNLTKIAAALGVAPEELAPDITAATVDRQNPEIALIAVAGHHDKVHLKVNKLVSMNIATLIMQLLDYANLVNRGLADPHEQPQLNLPGKSKITHLGFNAATS
jgi:transcriptional regulator with XRE-family HTH domain